MTVNNIKQAIIEGKTTLGIELGSSRIKAVLIDESCAAIASGGYNWENRLENGVWTYRLEDALTGVQHSFSRLAENVREQYGVALTNIGAIGISGMMHGYLVFDESGNQLAPFRTWRNTMTAQAAERLTGEFCFNIPQRWSVAHLYQAILNGESHINNISFITTLSGYVHWKLTGEKVVGVGEASGMFPIDSATNGFNKKMIQKFDSLISDSGLGWNIEDILPAVKIAGEAAGMLTESGAKLLDASGMLKAGIPMCPPEGDAGTGMVATNSIAERTGNISAGTSIFAMIVMEKELPKVYTEIDIVSTPAGKPVAMVHCNNCTSDLDAWVKLFKEANELTGVKIDKSALYDALYSKALEGEADCGGLLSYNYCSGEHLVGLEQGRPLFTRMPDSRFTLANFMRALLYSSMATLRLGMDTLAAENVRVERLLGHGGLFKTKGVGQRLMAAALGVPVSVMESAGEGGAWGIAFLAAYSRNKEKNETLEAFLEKKVFSGNAGICVNPDAGDMKGFETFMRRYKSGLEIERTAAECLQWD